jgi:hypothetical protein
MTPPARSGLGLGNARIGGVQTKLDEQGPALDRNEVNCGRRFRGGRAPRPIKRTFPRGRWIRRPLDEPSTTIAPPPPSHLPV